MADETFQVAVAVGLQAAFGTADLTIAGLDITSGLDETDGLIRGVRDAGDGESGITIPNFVRVFREKAITGLTQNFSTFLNTAVDGLQIAYEVKGNGATTTTPASAEAKPLAAIDALNEGVGFDGTAITAPAYIYTPRASLQYLTLKLWVADMSWVLRDCLVSQRSTVYAPGDVAVRTDSIAVGAVDDVTPPAESIGAWSISYGSMDSLAAPVIEGVTHAWGVSRGFAALTINVNQNVGTVPDSAQTPAVRQVATQAREITASASVYLDGASGNSDFEYNELIKAVANTATFVFRLGPVAGASDVVNGVLTTLSNPEVRNVKYRSDGVNALADVELVCVDGTAGSEYTETYN